MAQRARATARIPRLLGYAGGLIALLQIIVSTGAAQANSAPILSLQQDVASLFGGTGADPTPELLALLPALVSTYLMIALCGLATLALCWYAGRRVALASAGANVPASRVGMRVARTSALIWIVCSLVAVLLTHADATLTGVLTSFDAAKLPLQIVGLLAQEAFFALIGLGLGAYAAIAGSQSVRSHEPPYRPQASTWPSPPPPPLPSSAPPTWTTPPPGPRPSA